MPSEDGENIFGVGYITVTAFHSASKEGIHLQA